MIFVIPSRLPSQTLTMSLWIFAGIFSLMPMKKLNAQTPRPRELGIKMGVLPPGKWNAITDVPGVLVGQISLYDSAQSIRTGVTAILPHPGNIFQEKVPAGIYIGNGFGKLMGFSQVEELGNLETPIVLTNTLNVPIAAQALIHYTLAQAGNENVRSVNAVVGETNDAYLNDIRGMHVREEHIFQAIGSAGIGQVEEGAVGAGTGTIAFGFKGGIGSASRKLPETRGGYTVGVLVQSNFGGILQIDGVPVGVELEQYYLQSDLKDAGDGSCMMIVATDAPLDSRNLKRMAKRAMLGLARTGGIASNGSGDYVIAFSTATENRIAYRSAQPIQRGEFLRNEAMSPLFLATIEATEEAIINSLFASSGFSEKGIEGLPVDKVLEIMRKYKRLKE